MNLADVEHLSALLAGRTPASDAPDDARRAAVAIVLRAAADELEVLLMRRAEREGDRWSGQVSLPGGHFEESDTDLIATAVRETREEVGLELDGTPVLGQLDDLQARARSKLIGTWIRPVVFHHTGEAQLTLGPEAADAFWLPLGAVRRGDLDDHHRYDHEGVVLKLPAWRFGDHQVWGLTHRILSGLLELAP